MPFIALANHLLKQNPQVCQQLAGYNGLRFGVRALDVHLNARIGAYGLLERSMRDPDAQFVLNPLAINRFLEGMHPDWSDVAIEGDTELGFNLLLIFSQLQYDPSNDIRRLITHPMLWQAGKKALHKVVNVLKPAEKPNQMADLVQEIGQLRLELAKLNKKINQLEEK